MKIILAGPPNTGKSCLRDGLKSAIHAIPEAHYPYVLTANPDGQGAWFHGAVSMDKHVADTLKDAYKGTYTDAFTAQAAAWVNNCAIPLTIVDIGGKTTPQNEAICQHATHAIILYSNDEDKLTEWQAFCHKLGITIVAEIRSVYDMHAEDVVPQLNSDGVWCGSVHYLERGEPLAERPTIQALARILVDIVNQESGPRTMVDQDANMSAYSDSTYLIDVAECNDRSTLLNVGFSKDHRGESDVMIPHSQRRLKELLEQGSLPGGPLLKINGPSSILVAVAISHVLAPYYETVAIFDPRLNKYVVSIAQGVEYALGSLID